MPRSIVAGNWKMNTTLEEAATLASEVAEGMAEAGNVELILCPPYISLAAVRRAVNGSGIHVGAQNMHFEASGAFTGEVSASMLRSLCHYVILGHSERRQLFGETDETVNRKVHAALAAGLRPSCAWARRWHSARKAWPPTWWRARFWLAWPTYRT